MNAPGEPASAVPGRTPGRPVRVLVVDDSLVIRRIVTEALAGDPAIEVVGTAPNGQVALERVAQLEPDAVTMDIEMPVMDGVEAVRALRRTHPRLPVVMFSTLTERGASATLDALGAGASDYVTKPSNVASFAESQREVREQLIPKLKALAGARRAARVGVPAVPPPPPAATRPPVQRARTEPLGVLAVGSSTGGPDALATVLAALPADLPVPVVVVQHMPPVFTRLLAARLDALSALTVAEAAHGEPLVPGRVLVAPGGRHLAVRRTAAHVVAELTDDPPENFCRPAVDLLFRSVAAAYGAGVLAAVLTGMGRDGQRGAGAVRDAGGEVFAQDEATSVVWGMPGAVVAAGQADAVLPLELLGPRLATALGRSAATRRAGVAR